MNPTLRSLLSVTALALTSSPGFGQEERSAPQPSSAAAPTPESATRADPTANAPALTLNEALQKIAAAPPRYPAHPPVAAEGEKSAPAEKDAAATVPKFVMATPPPAPRAETKPASPVANYVWVPGHYIPLEGKWRWVSGEWAAPATPTSVWIPAAYDVKTKTWNPGYWQPDRPAASDAAPAQKPDAAPKSETTPKPNGY